MFTTQCIIETGWSFCSLFIYWYELCRFSFAVFIQWERIIFWNLITKTSRSSIFWQKGYQDSILVSFTATPPSITAATHNGEQIFSPLSSKRKGFATKLCSSFGVTYQKMRHVGMKRRALKSKQDYSFWSCTKRRKLFSTFNDSIKFSLQKWIIYRPCVIQSPIAND